MWFCYCIIWCFYSNQKINYFSFNLGNNSTKLQGLWLISNWWTKILSHASVTPPDDPGNANIYLPFESIAHARDWIDEVPTVSKLKYLNISPNPGTCLSAISSKASGVISLPVKPVPPVVITTGGTGLTGRDITPEALDEIADKHIPGFGEIFRYYSLETVGTSSIQSRACAILSNGKYIFALPGSSGGVTDAWDKILVHQLDINHKPCNFVELFPRLKEK